MSAIGALHHVGIVVKDLAATESFLTDVLRLPVARRVGEAGSPLQMVFFDAGTVLIELVQFADPAIASARLGDRDAVIDHIALEVPSLDHARDLLATHGVATVQDAPLVTPVGQTHFTRTDTSAGISWQLLQLAAESPSKP